MMSESKQSPGYFIGGVGRSGTTLMVDMLGMHPALSPVYETDFVVEFLKFVRNQHPTQLKMAMELSLRWAEPLPFRPHNKREHERYHHGPHYVLFRMEDMITAIQELVNGLADGDVHAKVGQLISDLFALHASLDDKPGWINKVPQYVQFLPELKALFPEMRFIHCIRDGRDVACSVVTRPWGPNNFKDAASWWKHQILLARQFGSQYPESYVEVRYEDLIQDPETLLKRFCEFLGVKDASETILENYQEKGAETEVELTTSRLEKWRSKFSAEDSEAFWQTSGDLLADCGYAQ